MSRRSKKLEEAHPAVEALVEAQPEVETKRTSRASVVDVAKVATEKNEFGQPTHNRFGRELRHQGYCSLILKGPVADKLRLKAAETGMSYSHLVSAALNQYFAKAK